jgi:hypothetical protein
MDAELLKIVQQAVRDEVTASLWIMFLVGVCSAAIGAFAGSYLKKKGESLATKEDFDSLLIQLKTQTKATEDIKANVQRDLNFFTDSLARGRDLTTFRRERVAKHLDEVLAAYVSIYAIAQLVPLRKWLNSNADLETEERFRSALSQLRAHFGSLLGLGVLSDQTARAFADEDWPVLDNWNKLLGEAAYRTPELRAEQPDAPAFSSERYNKQWMEFMTAIENLGTVVKSLSRAISLPQ